MGRRRTGSVYSKGGRWWYALLLRSGKRWAKPVPPLPDGRTPTEADARVYLEEVVRRYVARTWDPEAPAPSAAAPRPAPTVSAYGAQWVATLTHASAFNEADWLRLRVDGSALGAQRLVDVRPQDVAAWVRELRATPSRAGGCLAPQTVRGYVGFLQKLFTQAVFDGVVAASPVVLPRGIVPVGHDKDPGARRTWRYTREEVVELLSAVEIPLDRRVLYALLFLAGLRRGEAIVLRWRDYDRARTPLGALVVARAMAPRRRIEKTTKTEVVREVPVHATLAAVLAEWRLSGWQATHGRAPTDEDLVVPTGAFTARHSGTTHKQLRADARTVGVAARRMHGARHTFISLCVDDGARPDVIAKITHTRPSKSAFDAYRTEAWSTLCAEVAKLRVVRRADVLPLWRAASGGGPVASSATDSATASMPSRGTHSPQGVSREGESQSTCDSPSRETPRDAVIPARSRDASRAEATDPDATDINSATAGSAIGPLSGELRAYAWLDRVLLEQGEP